MKRYKLSFLPLFESDMIEITDYITNHLNNPEVALRLVDDIETAINRRLETPLMFTLYSSSKNRPYPYYRINKYKELLCFLCSHRRHHGSPPSAARKKQH